jgi:hypothetical protein
MAAEEKIGVMAQEDRMKTTRGKVSWSRGAGAVGMFAFLCLAGILTLFSQASLRAPAAHGGAGGEWTSLNPGTTGTRGLGRLLPTTVEQGARLDETAGEGDSEEKGETAAVPVLRLR